MAARKRTTKNPARRTGKITNMEGVWQRTQLLVESLLETLSQGINSPQAMPEHWERLFGTKDSVVANVQKLVGLLIELRQHFQEVGEDNAPEMTRMDSHELEMLEAWLQKQKETVK